MPEFDSIILFAREHIVPILMWYFLAGAIAAISGKRSQIEAWCAAHPKVALVLHLLRATGFDYLKAIAAVQNYVRFRAGLPPATLLVLLVAASSALSMGCSLEAARTKRLNSQLEAARAAAPAKARPESECRFLDGVHIWGDWTAGGLAAVGAGAGVFASSTRDEDVKRAAIWTGVGAAALGAVAVGLASRSASTWSEQCQ